MGPDPSRSAEASAELPGKERGSRLRQPTARSLLSSRGLEPPVPGRGAASRYLLIKGVLGMSLMSPKVASP